MSEIIIAYPPIVEEIQAVFPAVGKTSGIIFSWGDKIYNPSNVVITPALAAHELVHGQRQTNDEAAIIKWWRTYLADPEFRVNEELLGHKAELNVLLFRVADRNQRNMLVQQIAMRLSGPIYGNAITLSEARKRLSS
jgi:hypothetical protein